MPPQHFEGKEISKCWEKFVKILTIKKSKNLEKSIDILIFI